MSEFLLELYSEEIPFQLQINARTQLKQQLEKSLEEEGIQHKECFEYSSPTRLSIYIKSLPEKIKIKSFLEYINLYNDPLPSFSIDNGLARVDLLEILPPRIWRILSAVVKLYYEIFEYHSSSLTLKQKIRDILRRSKAIMHNKWS